MLIVVTQILKKTTTVNNNDKMDIVDENVCASILYSILNSGSNFYHECLREYCISPLCLNKKHVFLSKWRRKLKKGSKLDCLDHKKHWYCCTVVDCNENTNEVLIQYFGWDKKWNEWVVRDNPRLQPFKSVAKGGKEQRSVTRDIASVVKQNFGKYEVSDDGSDNKDTKKFGIFQGLLSQNISFRLVDAINVFGENNGFNLLLKILPVMKNMQNVKCILTILEKVSGRAFFCFFFDIWLSGLLLFVFVFVVSAVSFIYSGIS